jgi:hypothetical protein
VFAATFLLRNWSLFVWQMREILASKKKHTHAQQTCTRASVCSRQSTCVYLYSSSDTTVFHWPYQLGDVGGGVEIVIINISADGMGEAPGGLTTRTLAFDTTGRIYASVESAGNVDSDFYRSRIRRCDLSSTLPVDFDACEVFADGLCNEVGLAFDKHGVLWGVENGADQLERSDLGEDIHNDNPAEELNRFPEENAGLHWGYPYCWTEFKLPNTTGLGRGTRRWQ